MNNQDIINIVKGCCDDIEDIKIIDVYNKDNTVKYTYRVSFRNKTRTLTKNDVNKYMEIILNKLKQYGICVCD